MMQQAPIVKDLVLIGGGHSHALVLRQWAMNPMPGVRVTLISPQIMTPYSGMLPGLVAGHYTFEQTHIDLARLCLWGQVRFIQDAAVKIDSESQQVILAERPSVCYDVLSIDIGSTPTLSVPGSQQFATPVKPISEFYQRWQQFLINPPNSVAVVGGGAGSLELVLSMAQRLSSTPCQFHLITRSEHLLPGYPKGVIKAAQNALDRFQVKLTTGFSVAEVHAKELHSDKGQVVAFDELFWVTQASAAQWPAHSGLATDSLGFVQVNEYLQSVSHENIFAAGDIAHMVASPRPKAGVFAVRQAPFLFNNLRAQLTADTDSRIAFKSFKPQKGFLSLLALGDQTATGYKGWFTFSGPWVWRWKDRIDQAFMDKFHHLPSMAKPSDKSENLNQHSIADESLNQPRCSGCGAKVPSDILAEVFTELTGKYQPADACQVSQGKSPLWQTIDQLNAVVDDPYRFGRIAVHHGVNDLYGEGKVPQSIQVAVTLPVASPDIHKRELRSLMVGVFSAAQEHQCEVVGGHTNEGPQLSVTVVANGIKGDKNLQLSKANLAPGHVLILTKPLGIGLMLAAAMENRISGEEWAQTLNAMDHNSAQQLTHIQSWQPSTCTDVTGFGFLGHLQEMVGQSGQTVTVNWDAIPLLPGVERIIQQGVASSLLPGNRNALLNTQLLKKAAHHPHLSAFLDPQTSGGFLAAIAPEYAQAAKLNGYWLVGQVERQHDESSPTQSMDDRSDSPHDGF